MFVCIKDNVQAEINYEKGSLKMYFEFVSLALIEEEIKIYFFMY